MLIFVVSFADIRLIDPVPGARRCKTACTRLARGTTEVQGGMTMRNLLAGLAPIAAGLAIAVILHRTERSRQAD